MTQLPTPPEGYSSWLEYYQAKEPVQKTANYESHFRIGGRVLQWPEIESYTLEELLAQREQQAEEARQAIDAMYAANDSKTEHLRTAMERGKEIHQLRADLAAKEEELKQAREDVEKYRGALAYERRKQNEAKKGEKTELKRAVAAAQLLRQERDENIKSFLSVTREAEQLRADLAQARQENAELRRQVEQLTFLHDSQDKLLDKDTDSIAELRAEIERLKGKSTPFQPDYTDEARKLIREIYDESVTPFESFAAMESVIFANGMTYESMGEDIQTGVKNGYPIDVQKKLLKHGLKTLLKQSASPIDEAEG